MISTRGAKAHFETASLSQWPVVVTQAPTQGWIPQTEEP